MFVYRRSMLLCAFVQQLGGSAVPRFGSSLVTSSFILPPNGPPKHDIREAGHEQATPDSEPIKCSNIGNPGLVPSCPEDGLSNTFGWDSSIACPSHLTAAAKSM